MSLQFTPDIGLQHTLENGLSIIEGHDFDADRRRKVLNRLVEIFSEAAEGSKVLEPKYFLIAVQNRPAFERFNLFYRYLKERFDDEVPTRLTATLAVLQQMLHEQKSDEQHREAAATLIKTFLSCLDQEEAFAPLAAPETVE